MLAFGLLRWPCHMLAAASLLSCTGGAFSITAPRSCEALPAPGQLAGTRTAVAVAEEASSQGSALGFVQVGSKALKPAAPAVSVAVKVSVEVADTAAKSTGSTKASKDQQSASALAAMQLEAGLASQTTSKAMDTGDRWIMVVALVGMFMLYLVMGHFMGVDEDKLQSSIFENRIHDYYHRATDWIRPRLDELAEHLPAISGALLGQNADMPLLIPIKELEARRKQTAFPLVSGGSDSVSWSIEVKGISGKKKLVLRQMKLEDGSPGCLEVLGRQGNMQSDKLLAKMDHNLRLYNSEGADFGNLVLKQSGSYELKESATGRHRWLVTSNFQLSGFENFTITWRPLRRLLATVSRGHKSHKDYFKVMPGSGVDAVLVVLCCVGLFVFRHDADEDVAQAVRRDKASKATEDATEIKDVQGAHDMSSGRASLLGATGGSAGQLLSGLSN